MAHLRSCPAGTPPWTYSRREPEKTPLYRVFQQHLPTFERVWTDTEDGGCLPKFVTEELRGFLECGILAHGFAQMHCESCRKRHLVAFSCKGRGFCPSCLGRRMNEGAANLVDHVLPEGVPIRQWVLTLPHPLRYPLAFDGRHPGQVLRIFTDTVGAWYRRDHPGSQTGAVTVIQRASSDLRLNPHFHTLFLDGVYHPGPEGEAPVFRTAPKPTQEDIEGVVRRAKRRILRYLEKRGVISFAAAPGDGAFNLHAARRVAPNDRQGRERLCRYILRPPMAHERLHLLEDGNVILEFKRPWKDGTCIIALEPKALLTRLSAIVPPPRRHVTLYFGVLSSHSKWRNQVVPKANEEVEGSTAQNGSGEPIPAPVVEIEIKSGTGPRSRYVPWHELLRRTFGSEIVCPDCGGKLKLIALVKTETTLRTILAAMHLPTGPPQVAAPTPPPEEERLKWKGEVGEADWASGKEGYPKGEGEGCVLG